MRSWILIAISLVSLAITSGALAQKPDKKARDEAKKLFLQGKKLYEEAKYDEAIDAFQAANERAPSPKILFNIAQSYRLKGDKRNAKAYYEQYLSQESVGQIADEARSHVETLTKSIALEEEETRKQEEARLAEEQKKSEEAERRQAEEQKQRDEEDRRRAAEEAQRRQAAEAERQRLAEERRRLAEERRAAAERGPSTLQKVMRWGGLGMAIVGGVLFTYGAYEGSEAHRLESDIEDDVARLGYYPEDIVPRLHQGNRAESRAIFGLVAGSIAVAGGGVLFWLGGRVEVEPVVESRSLGTSLRWTW